METVYCHLDITKDKYRPRKMAKQQKMHLQNMRYYHKKDMARRLDSAQVLM